MTLTKAKTPPSQVETLAKLYLEGKPAEIADETIAQLCNWLMDEFHQLPLNLQFADYMRYANVEEMFADIEQGHLWVSADSYDVSVYPNPIYGFIFGSIPNVQKHSYHSLKASFCRSFLGQVAKLGCSLIFQGVHDYEHFLTKTDFSLEGEIAAYKFAAKRSPSLEIQKIFYSEIVLRTSAYLYLGHAASPKIVFL